MGANAITTWLTRLITIIPQKAAQKPCIEKFGKKLEAKIKRAIFMITAKSPSVKKMTGRAISSTTGFIRELNIPNMTPAKRSSIQLPLKLKPETEKSAILMAIALARIWMMILEIKCMVLENKITHYFFLRFLIFSSIIFLSFSTLFPETRILMFFLVSRFWAFVNLLVIWFNYRIKSQI